MTVTYDPALLTDRDHVRFTISDTVADSGPKPNGGNFQDAEIDAVLEAEGNWQRAVANLFEVLAAAWATFVDTALGNYKKSASQTAEAYRALAGEWRRQYGYGAGGGIEVVHLTRIDGYSQDVPADEIEEVGAEYST